MAFDHIHAKRVVLHTKVATMHRFIVRFLRDNPATTSKPWTIATAERHKRLVGLWSEAVANLNAFENAKTRQ
jgi:hypothetical protein